MGGAKAWMMDQEHRGYWKVEGNVCANCFLDPALKKFVKNNAISNKCDFCDRHSKRPIAAPFDDVVGVIVSAFHYEWNNPDNEGIGFESAEGGYLASLVDTYDLIYDHYEISDNESVCIKLHDSIINQLWVEKDYYIGSEGKRFQWGWDAFRNEVTYKKRFVFLYDEGRERDYGEITPSDFLFDLANFKNNRLDRVSLIKKIMPDIDIFRVRAHKTKLKTSKELGAVPQDKANQANRMSPAGISMFYGAFDAVTSIKETFDPNIKKDEKWISIAAFRPTRTLLFLDLATLPSIPSIFDEEKRHMIQALRFFHGFARDISKPISRNGREHVEYVPTQIVTEFFKHIYRTGNGMRLDGIIYRSSKNEGKTACVIFCDNVQACDEIDAHKDSCLLELKKVTYKKIT